MKTAKLKIKIGDTVEVITGSSKGTKGSVLAIDRNKFKIKVQGANLQSHFSTEDGVSEKEGFMHYSNVKLVEAKQSKKGKQTKQTK